MRDKIIEILRENLSEYGIKRAADAIMDMIEPLQKKITSLKQLIETTEQIKKRKHKRIGRND